MLEKCFDFGVGERPLEKKLSQETDCTGERTSLVDFQDFQSQNENKKCFI